MAVLQLQSGVAWRLACAASSLARQVSGTVASRLVLSLLFNPLKPTGHVMQQRFNIQQLYALPTLYLCVLYLSENKQRLVQLTA